MKHFQKIPGLECLISAVLMLSAISLAQSPQSQQQTPGTQPSLSTSELEAQPNTAGYPGRRRQLVNPGPPTADQEAPPNSVETPQYRVPQRQPATTPVVPGTGAQSTPAGSAVPAAPETPASVNNKPQNSPAQVMIGPPAPLPPTPEQMPPTPAKITYQNGMLSIESTNARLSDILNGIHNKTGIQFEGMQPGQDRVAGKFGPAPADEVLAGLLRGSRFDYIIIGVPDNPAVVQRVILSPNAGAGASPATAGAQPPQPSPAEDEENGGEEQGEPQEQVQTPQQPPRPPVPAPQPSGNAGPKTPEQLVEELKQMQQQQQQQQQQNPNQQTPNAPIKPPARRPLNPQ